MKDMRIMREMELLPFLESKEYNTREELLRAICLCFEEKKEILKRELEMDIESIFYSEYYWNVQFKNEYTKKNGFDAGIDQHIFKLLERVPFDVDWDIIEKIEGNFINV